jgi:hypothetical protein
MYLIPLIWLCIITAGGKTRCASLSVWHPQLLAYVCHLCAASAQVRQMVWHMCSLTSRNKSVYTNCMLGRPKAPTQDYVAIRAGGVRQETTLETDATHLPRLPKRPSSCNDNRTRRPINTVVTVASWVCPAYILPCRKRRREHIWSVYLSCKRLARATRHTVSLTRHALPSHSATEDTQASCCSASAAATAAAAILSSLLPSTPAAAASAAACCTASLAPAVTSAAHASASTAHRRTEFKHLQRSSAVEALRPIAATATITNPAATRLPHRAPAAYRAGTSLPRLHPFPPPLQRTGLPPLQTPHAAVSLPPQSRAA